MKLYLTLFCILFVCTLSALTQVTHLGIAPVGNSSVQ